jgi:hypothetical protein
MEGAMARNQGRARRYRDRAEECLRLAELATVQEIANHYRRISEHYLELAEADETVGTKGDVRTSGDPTAEPGL